MCRGCRVTSEQPRLNQALMQPLTVWVTRERCLSCLGRERVLPERRVSLRPALLRPNTHILETLALRASPGPVVAREKRLTADQRGHSRARNGRGSIAPAESTRRSMQRISRRIHVQPPVSRQLQLVAAERVRDQTIDRNPPC